MLEVVSEYDAIIILLPHQAQVDLLKLLCEVDFWFVLIILLVVVIVHQMQHESHFQHYQ
jgi:hypothetical protein